MVSTQSLCEDKLEPTGGVQRGKGAPKNSCNAAKNSYLNLLLCSVTTIVILKRKKQSSDYSYFSLGACVWVLIWCFDSLPLSPKLQAGCTSPAKGEKRQSLFLPISVDWSWSKETLTIWDESSAASVDNENNTSCTICREGLKRWYSGGQEEEEGVLYTSNIHGLSLSGGLWGNRVW